MQAISEEGSTSSTSRKILIAIDDNYACEKACDFALREFYRLVSPLLDYLFVMVAFVIPSLPDSYQFCLRR